MLIRKLVHICLALIFLLNLFGCATKAAWRLAKEKSSASKTIKKILYVHPTAVREDDNIKICVNLSCESEDCNGQNYLVSLPFNSLASGKTKAENEDLEKSLKSIDPYFQIYWYPLKKRSKGCAEIAEITVPSETKIRIEKLFLPSNEWYRLRYDLPKNKENLFAILNKYNDVVLSKGALYSLNIRHESVRNDEILLIYLPNKDIDSGFHAVGIVAGYEDNNTKTGYALIPFAIIVDAMLFIIWTDPLNLHISERCNQSVLTGVSG